MIMRLALVALLLGLWIEPVRAEERVIVFTMADSRFRPAALRVEPGTQIRFQVVNDDPIDHELIVGDADVHRRHEVGREGHHHGDVPGEVSVEANGTAVTTYRFTAPGVVEFGCHLPGHWDYGMRGVVTVG